MRVSSFLVVILLFNTINYSICPGSGEESSGQDATESEGQGDTSGTTGTTATPETPGTPETPATQGTPGTPETPATPGTPETPGTQGTPETPATPGTPGAAGGDGGDGGDGEPPEEEPPRYSYDELLGLFKIDHYPEYFIEGGMMNFSYSIVIPDELKEKYSDLNEDILISQSGIYEVTTNDNYLLYHTGKFFSAAILSPKIPSHFKFLDAGETYIVLYDFTDLLSQPHQMLFNVQVLEHVLRLLSPHVIPFVPNHDPTDHTGLLQRYGIQFMGHYYYELGQDLKIDFAEEEDSRAKFVYVFNDDDMVHNMEVAELKKNPQTLDANGYSVQVHHNSVTIKNVVYPPGFYVGYEVKKDASVDHKHVISSSGYFIPKDYVTVTPATNENRKLRWKFKDNPRMLSFKIILHYTNYKSIHEIGECILVNTNKPCEFSQHQFVDEFDELKISEISLKNVHTSKVFIKFILKFQVKDKETVIRTEYYCAYNCEAKADTPTKELDVPKTDAEKTALEKGKYILSKIQISEETPDVSVRNTLAKECDKEIKEMLKLKVVSTLPGLKEQLENGAERVAKLIKESDEYLSKNKENIDKAKKLVVEVHKKHTICVHDGDFDVQTEACNEADRLANEAKKLCQEFDLTYDMEIMEELHKNILKELEHIKERIHQRDLSLGEANKLKESALQCFSKVENEKRHFMKLYHINDAVEKLIRAKEINEEFKAGKEAIETIDKHLEETKKLKEPIIKDVLSTPDIQKEIKKKLEEELKNLKQSYDKTPELIEAKKILTYLIELSQKTKIHKHICDDLNEKDLSNNYGEILTKMENDISVLKNGLMPSHPHHSQFNALSVTLIIFLIIIICTILGLFGVYSMKKRKYRLKKAIVINDSVSSI